MLRGEDLQLNMDSLTIAWACYLPYLECSDFVIGGDGEDMQKYLHHIQWSRTHNP